MAAARELVIGSWWMDQDILKRQTWADDVPAEQSEIRQRVSACFRTTAAGQERILQPLSDDLLLLDSGLDSLCFAIIVAELEDQLGVDPFSDLDDAGFPVTFGEFVELYEAAARRGG
jgi:acyl carrier protein